VTELIISVARYTDPDAQLLIKATLQDMGERYGNPEGDATPVDPAEFDAPHGTFLVGYLDGEPVCCGAWRSHGDDGTVAELKRMYTSPAVRGRGLARRLLAAVEESARQAGRQRMILETGYLQPESIALYTSVGYQRIENFGHYRNEEGVRSFGRDL